MQLFRFVTGDDRCKSTEYSIGVADGVDPSMGQMKSTPSCSLRRDLPGDRGLVTTSGSGGISVGFSEAWPSLEVASKDFECRNLRIVLAGDRGMLGCPIPSHPWSPSNEWCDCFSTPILSKAGRGEAMTEWLTARENVGFVAGLRSS